ncbi:MAG TPA: phosphatidate cytidylyltransferase [Bacillota bacterium]|nr:phosphatidate cytidylyltransferase [Bacillota bacterium]
MIQRILTAVVALIIFVPFVLYGKWPFMLFIYLLATIGFMELIDMSKIKKHFFPVITSILALWMILYPGMESELPYTHLTKTDIIIILSMLLFIYTVLLKNKFNFQTAGFYLISLAYISIGFYFFMYTRDVGLSHLLYALFIVWATDTGAYFVGRRLGRRKLMPSISPKKTVEGAMGGIVCASIVAIVFQFVAPFPVSFLTMIGITVLASIAGQLGDLVESAFKRHFGVKDSGTILPGHGGILDRFDSLLFVLPFLYVIGFI